MCSTTTDQRGPSRAAEPPWLERNRRSLIASATATTVLTATVGLAVAQGGRAGPIEANYFSLANQLPDQLGPVLHLFAATGAPATIALVATAAVVSCRTRVGIIVGLVTLAGWAASQLLDAMVPRQAPAATIEWDVELRGWAIGDAGSFAATSVLLAAALATVVAPHLPADWRWVPVTAVIGNGVAQMWAGAHLPLDVVASAATGVLVGSLLDLLLQGSHRARTTATDRARRSVRPPGALRSSDRGDASSSQRPTPSWSDHDSRLPRSSS